MCYEHFHINSFLDEISPYQYHMYIFHRLQANMYFIESKRIDIIISKHQYRENQIWKVSIIILKLIAILLLNFKWQLMLVILLIHVHVTCTIQFQQVSFLLVLPANRKLKCNLYMMMNRWYKRVNYIFRCKRES